ncbi:MAG: hypothetical protein U0Q16_28915 [Bryobacteraceae bacterium]
MGGNVRLFVLFIATRAALGSGYSAEPMHLPPDSPIRRMLLIPGDAYHGSEVFARDGDRWLALTRTPAGYRTSVVTLRIKPAHDGVLDAGNQLTGKSVAVAESGDPVFLTKGFRHRAGRAVPTAFDGEAAITRSNPVHFFFQARKIELLALPTGRSDEYPPGTKVEILQVNIKQGDKTTPLPLVVTDYNGVHLLWCGDLDGDSKPDFLFEDSGDDWTSYRLFLSTAAKPGEIAGEAGQFFITGC